MSNKELKELMSIICEGQDSEQRRKVENFIEYQVQLIDSLDKEIERLNNDIKVLLKENENKEKVIKAQDNIIKEVRAKLYDLNHKIKEIHNVPFDISEIFEMIEILDKVSDK